MNTKEFKTLLSKVAKGHGFEFLYGGWFREFPECLIVLDVQKSNFGNYCYVNVRIFVQGTFGRAYARHKDLVKSGGDVFRRTPPEFDEALNFDSNFNLEEREQILKKIFQTFLEPFVEDAATRAGLFRLETAKKVFLLPAMKAELERLQRGGA